MPELNTSNKSKIGINGIAFPKLSFLQQQILILSQLQLRKI